MSISFHASSRASSPISNPNNGSTLTLTKPSVSAGDILIAAIFVNLASASATLTYSPPTGWTQIGTTAKEASTDTVQVQLFWALQSVSSLGFTAAVSGATSRDVDWVVSSWSGVDNTTPIDAIGTNATGSASSVTLSSFSCGSNVQPVWAICDFAGGVFTATGYTVLPTATPGTIAGAQGYDNSAVSSTCPAVTIHDSAGATLLAASIFTLNPATGTSFVARNPLVAGQAIVRSALFKKPEVEEFSFADLERCYASSQIIRAQGKRHH